MNSTKSLIISILREEFPISLTQIYKKVKKTNKISYQGVRKAINELIKEEVVEKIEKQYFLNKEWVKEQTKLFSKAYSNYFNVNYNSNQIDERSKIQTFRFSSLYGVLDFILQAYSKGHLKNENSNKLYVFLTRLPPIIPPELLQVIKKLQKDNEICVFCKSDKTADRWAAKFYRSLNMKVKTGVNVPHQNIMYFGDFMLQLFCFYSSKHANEVYTFENKFEKKSKSSLLKMMDKAFNKKAELYVILNRYPVFLEDVKEFIERTL
ncbi:hypothetical protein ACFL0W_06205 [Nanoarchaeota archaeon]